MKRGVLERLFFVKQDGEFVRPPLPATRDTFSYAMLFFSDALSTHIRGSTRMSSQKFVDNYSGRKRRVYEEAVSSLLVKPLTTDDAKLKTFVKHEKLLKDDAVPRIINPRDPRYNVELGRYVKAVEKNIYRSINKVYDVGTPVVMKGLNQLDRATNIVKKWSRFDDPVAIPMDASRFDQHVHVSALLYSHNVYKQYFPGDTYLNWLLSMQLSNHGKGKCGDGFLSYTLLGGRMSGDVDTSLGNILLMCSMFYSYIHSIGITKFDFINDGDDCVAFIERKQLGLFSSGVNSYFLSLGFNMKVEPAVDVLEEIEFCQSHPFFDGSGWIMIRNITSISKDAVSLVHWNNPSDAKRWMKAVGLCGISMNGGVPIYQAYYNSLVRLAGTSKAFAHVLDYGMLVKSAGMTRSTSVVSDESRLSFWRVTGIPPDCQRTIELHYDTIEFTTETILSVARSPRLLPW